jgi:lipopolysaccharide biosynthesis regulator YciM
MREWRGDATAFAVYSLGEVEARQGRWTEAIARYQRVFVAYQKYLPWVAKAYVRSAEGFDKLGRRSDAINSLKEMLHNEKLVASPEAAHARKLLEEWGASA